jgi:hypothetical protein
MKNTLIAATLPLLVAIAAYMLSVFSPTTAFSIVGYGSVAMLLGLAALEYRFKRKRIFSRT